MFTSSLALAGLVIFWYMSVLFIIALIRRDNSIADIAWGPGFLLATTVVYLWQRPEGLAPLVTLILVAVWSVRLATHILLRNWGRGEDWRYASWRKQWGDWFVLRAYLQVFMLQGILMLLVVSPALWIVTFGGSPGALVWVGVAVWLVGFLFESIGDAQLTRFLKDPANNGRVMQSGLWRFTRHPNYFGEVLLWWGVWLCALSVAGGWMTFIGPLTITLLILFVSGIPLLEAKQMKSPEFRDYARRTSIFVPWFPKKSTPSRS
jgi:steroid 5-alpha reductase family enzyme